MKNNPLSTPELGPPATRDQVEKFLKGLQQFRSRGFSPLSKSVSPEDEIELKKYDQAAVKNFLSEMTVGMRESIAQRIIMDILKPPMSVTGDQRKRTTKKKKVSRAKPARGSKSKRAPSKTRPTSKKRKAKKRK
jgi:hypothetical protein